MNPTPPVCLNCHKTSQSNIILKCDHQLCYSCAQEIKKLQNNNPLDIKYKLTCPYCQMNTITLNIANLISQQQDKLVFINMQDSQLSERELQKDQIFQYNHNFNNNMNGNISGNKNYQQQDKDFKINQLRQMSYSDRIAVIFTDRRTPQLPERINKRASVDSNRQRVSKSRQGYQTSHQSLQIQCIHHKQQNIIFYCKQQNSLLCMQCMYKHMKQHKDHNISSIKDSISVIQIQNSKFKQQARIYIQQIQKQMALWKVNKSKLQQAYIFLQQMIKKQFKQLQTLLKQKQKQTTQFLQKIFNKRQQQLNMKYQQLNETKQILNDYYRFPIENFYSQVYFFNNYCEVKQSLQENPSYKVKQYKDQDLLCFNRNSTTKDFQILIDKLFVPNVNDGRQSGKRSRAASRSNVQKSNKNQQLLKEIPEETIKMVKRKMKQLNKKIDNSKDFNKKDKKYQFLQNFNLQEIANKKIDKGNSLNQKKTITSTTTPIPQQLQKYTPLKKSIKK